MQKWRRLFISGQGTAAVEFALFLPIFLTILFGIIELGSAWYTRQVLVNASREGARLAVLPAPDGPTNNEVETYVDNLLDQAGFAPSRQVVSDGAEGAAGDLVTVTVSSNFRFPVLGAFIPNLGDEGNITITASTVMRHE